MKPYRFDDRYQFIVVKTIFYILHYKTIVGGNSSEGVCMHEQRLWTRHIDCITYISLDLSFITICVAYNINIAMIIL